MRAPSTNAYMSFPSNVFPDFLIHLESFVGDDLVFHHPYIQLGG